MLSDERGARGGRDVAPGTLKAMDELVPLEGEDGGGVSTAATLRRLLASSLVREMASPPRLAEAPLISPMRFALTTAVFGTSGDESPGVRGSWCAADPPRECRLIAGVEVAAGPPSRPGRTLVDADGSEKKSIRGCWLPVGRLTARAGCVVLKELLMLPRCGLEGDVRAGARDWPRSYLP